MMSQMIQWLEIREGQRYLFHVTFDSRPDQGELERAHREVSDALAVHKVPPESVGVVGFKCLYDKPELSLPCSPILEGARYLVAALVLADDGAFTEDPAEVSKRVVAAFSRFANTPETNISTIVLENTGLAVDVTEGA